MRPFVIAAILLSINPISGVTQSQSSPATHQHPSAAVIDGSVHPELIPDLTAYRMWLLAVSRPPTATDYQKKTQHLQLERIALKPVDENSIIAILTDFNIQYRRLIDDYNSNATAQVARGDKPDLAAMCLQRDLLVQSTRDRIMALLKPADGSRLSEHVRKQKRTMKIGLQGGQQ